MQIAPEFVEQPEEAGLHQARSIAIAKKPSLPCGVRQQAQRITRQRQLDVLPLQQLAGLQAGSRVRGRNALDDGIVSSVNRLQVTRPGARPASPVAGRGQDGGLPADQFLDALRRLAPLEIRLRRRYRVRNRASTSTRSELAGQPLTFWLVPGRMRTGCVRQPRACQPRLQVGEPLLGHVARVKPSGRAHQRAGAAGLPPAPAQKIGDHLAALQRHLQIAEQLAALSRTSMPPSTNSGCFREGRFFSSRIPRANSGAAMWSPASCPGARLTRRLHRIHAQIGRRRTVQRRRQRLDLTRKAWRESVRTASPGESQRTADGSLVGLCRFRDGEPLGVAIPRIGASCFRVPATQAIHRPATVCSGWSSGQRADRLRRRRRSYSRPRPRTRRSAWLSSRCCRVERQRPIGRVFKVSSAFGGFGGKEAGVRRIGEASVRQLLIQEAPVRTRSGYLHLLAAWTAQ